MLHKIEPAHSVYRKTFADFVMVKILNPKAEWAERKKTAAGPFWAIAGDFEKKSRGKIGAVKKIIFYK